MTQENRIKQLYQQITENLFYKDFPEIDIIKSFTKLANECVDSEINGEEMSYIGEFEIVPLTELLIAAYHFFSDYHSGQWSAEYAAMCAISQIYTPGCGESEYDQGTYDSLVELLHRDDGARP